MSARFKVAHLVQIATSKEISCASKLANPVRVTSAVQILQTGNEFVLLLGNVVLTHTLAYLLNCSVSLCQLHFFYFLLRRVIVTCFYLRHVIATVVIHWFILALVKVLQATYTVAMDLLIYCYR